MKKLLFIEWMLICREFYCILVHWCICIILIKHYVCIEHSSLFDIDEFSWKLIISIKIYTKKIYKEGKLTICSCFIRII